MAIARAAAAPLRLAARPRSGMKGFPWFPVSILG